MIKLTSAARHHEYWANGMLIVLRLPRYSQEKVRAGELIAATRR